MRTFAQPALVLSLATALLVGCGGSQAPIGAPGAMPQNRALAARDDSSNYKVLYSFHGRPDGNIPEAGLIELAGTLYGTTEYGGSTGRGTVFTITKGGTEKLLYGFKKGHGEFPEASLIDVNGMLYGTTYLGGQGTVFSLTTGGVEEVIHHFVGAVWQESRRSSNRCGRHAVRHNPLRRHVQPGHGL